VFCVFLFSSCPFLDILHCLPRAVGVPLESALNLVSRMSPCGTRDCRQCDAGHTIDVNIWIRFKIWIRLNIWIRHMDTSQECRQCDTCHQMSTYGYDIQSRKTGYRSPSRAHCKAHKQVPTLLGGSYARRSFLRNFAKIPCGTHDTHACCARSNNHLLCLL